MKTLSSIVWAGTESSLQSSIQADQTVLANMNAGTFPPQNEEEEPNRLLTVSEGVATISIRGSLNNDPDSWWNEMTGRTGYPEIRDAVISAANDESVTQILLDIDSGGGAVAGVADTSKLIRSINDHVKPVTTYTEGMMASAAYWLGAAAGKVYAADSAIVGSIGVISTHIERSKQMEMDGITATVVRSGPYKALANSVEPLSAEGKAQIQKIVDAANGVFVSNISDMRNTPYATVDTVWGQGREFLGSEALKTGLIDGITTFDDLMGDVKKKSIDASKNFMDNRGNQGGFTRGTLETTLTGEADMKQKQALTAQNIAAIAAGVTLDAAIEVVAAVEPEPVVAAVEPEPVAAAVAQPIVEADKTALTVQLLNEQLASKDAAILQAGIKIAKLDEQHQEALATAGPMLEIVAKSCNNMQIALGGSAVDLKGMNAVQVLAEHQRLSAQFETKFKVGGVAAVSSVSDVKTGPAIDPSYMARVNAARFQVKK